MNVLTAPYAALASTLASAILELPPKFWALAALAVVADILPFALGLARRRFVTIFLSVSFTFAILLLCGVGWAILVQAVAVLFAALRLRPGVKPTVALAARMTLAFLAAHEVLKLFGTPTFDQGQELTTTDGFHIVLAALAWFVVYYAALAVWARLRRFTSWREIWTRHMAYDGLSMAALLLLAPLLNWSPGCWALLLVVVPMIAINQLARVYNQQVERIRHDPLTGLLSRQALMEEVAAVAAGLRPSSITQERPHFALFMLDLDRFKQVNDTLGHAVGDRLLAVVAKRLTGVIPTGDMVARLGGDEFAVLATRVRDQNAALGRAEHISQALAIPAELDGQPLDINASIGVALYPEHGRDYETLMRHADVAMYEAKRRSDAIAVYSPECDPNTPARLGLLSDLRQALEHPAHHAEITFDYQPQVSIKTGEVVGIEALLRWRHPDRGLVDVGEILLAAEHSPVMAMLTRRAVEEVVTQLSRWNALGLTLRASINVSVRDLETHVLVDTVASALRRHDVRPSQLEVEITETALMGDLSPAQATLRRLAHLGVALSLDDFGTGYSSLAHLRQLPVAEIKIDRSFTSRAATDAEDRLFVCSIIALGHSFGLRIVAEGVEDERTLNLLAEAGCDVAQGWFFAKAMPAHEVIAWMARHAQAASAPAPQPSHRR